MAGEVLVGAGTVPAAAEADAHLLGGAGGEAARVAGWQPRMARQARLSSQEDRDTPSLLSRAAVRRRSPVDQVFAWTDARAARRYAPPRLRCADGFTMNVEAPAWYKPRCAPASPAKPTTDAVPTPRQGDPAMRTLALGLALLALLALAPPLRATCGGGGGGGIGGVPPRGGSFDAPRGKLDDLAAYQVPWKTLGPGDPAPAGILVLYWFPVSKQEEQAADLQSSRQLTQAAARCVGLSLVGLDNTALREKYGVKGDLSLAILATAADGTEVGRVQGKYGRPVDRGEVERLVSDGIKRREKVADERLDAARAKENGGDKDGAAALYTQVWDERCLATGPARKAAKALKKLGRPVPDAVSLETPEPDPSPATEKALARALAAGLRAENELRLADAERSYAAAARLDPADPVPLRYLGELYRHHTGDWARARTTFERILTLRADPLSRAVALHGLGKMTIHAGDFQKGLAMFEESVRTYPLALTYRNLAVYWSRRGRRRRPTATSARRWPWRPRTSTTRSSPPPSW